MDKLVKVRRPCQTSTAHQLAQGLTPAPHLHHLLALIC